MKKSNILQLLEQHIDKIVLGLMSVISLALLWVYVLGNPYGAEVMGKKRGPGEIDSYVKTQAEQMVADLDNTTSDPMPYNKSYLAEYDQLMQCPVSQIAALPIPYPGIGEAVEVEDRLYDLPRIEPLMDVMAANLRGAAQVPTEEVRPDMPYQSTPWELADVDLVTVSAKFNIQSLVNSFQQSFTGPRLKTTWKDPALAKPVFAQLSLERRELADDGTWGEWAVVPRSKIDMYKKLLESLPLTTEQLQYGVNIWMSQFADKAVQRDILQPPSYTFAISRTEWQPPAYLEESLELIKKQEDLRLRKEREERAKRLDSPMGGDRRPEVTRPSPADRRQENRRQTDTRRGRENPFEMGLEDPTLTAQRPAPKRERTLEDVKNDLKKIMLDDKTDPETMRDALMMWAHDDTVLPGKTYQYRLRLGVFNPIAGKNWFRSEQAAFKNQVVLWSEYTEPTKAIFIQKRIHVFPMELIAAKNSPDGTQGVKVEVAKYDIGQWKTQTFDVYPGQIIGQKAEIKPEDLVKQTAGREMGLEGEFMMLPIAGAGGEIPTGPQIVDFTTPFTMVDISHLINWGANGQSRRTFDLMLYYDPQKQMLQAAIGKNAWDSALRKDYQQVQDEIQQGLQMRTPGSSPLMPNMPPIFEGGERMMGGA